MDEELEKLLEYRDRVVVERERRAERVKRLEHSESSTQYTLEAEKRGRRVLAGSTIEALGRAAYRSRLERELKEARTELVEAREELKRAEERLAQVDAEIAEKEAATDGGADGAEEAVAVEAFEDGE